MTQAELAQLAALVVSYWPNFELTQAQFSIMERQVADVPLSVVIAAVDALAGVEPKFFPGWGAIRVRAIQLSSPGVPSAADALEEVREAIRARGPYQSPPTWTHPAIKTVVNAMGGWRHLCLSSSDQLARQFVSLYQPRAERAQRDALLPPSARAVMQFAGTRELASSLMLPIE